MGNFILRLHKPGFEEFEYFDIYQPLTVAEPHYEWFEVTMRRRREITLLLSLPEIDDEPLRCIHGEDLFPIH